jgi:carbon monoxide dehydrogenase subunit G
MELHGSQVVRAPRQQVWDALNDPVILSRCIPGCEEVAKVSETEMHTRVAVKIGPVRARFSGKIFMSDIVAPSACTLSFEGTGGAAGFAKGSSRVSLTDEGTATRLTYSVEASVGGKLGQIGGRLIDSSAKKMADEFFAAFDAALTGGSIPVVEAAVASAGVVYPVSSAGAPSGTPANLPPMGVGGFGQELVRAFWFGLGVAVTLLLTRWLH